MGAVRTLYEEMVIGSLEIDRFRRERHSQFLGNNQFGDLARGIGRGNIRAHCFEGDESALVPVFVPVARQPNSRGTSKSEFMKDLETSMVKGVIDMYWVVPAGSVIFNILDSIKARRNEARGHHCGSRTQNWSGKASEGMKPVSSKSRETKHSEKTCVVGEAS